MACRAWPGRPERTPPRGGRHDPNRSLCDRANPLWQRTSTAGLRERYRHLGCGDWWDEDPTSARYNRFVVVPCGVTPGFAAGSEALWTETVVYPYFAVIEFNAHPIRRGRGAPGSGIFLHSWEGAPTAARCSPPLATAVIAALARAGTAAGDRHLGSWR